MLDHCKLSREKSKVRIGIHMAQFVDYYREKSLLYQSWSNAGVQKVVDLLNKDGSFFSFDEFLKKLKIKTNYLEYFKVISALRQYKNMCLPIDDGVASKAVLGFRLPDTNTCRKVYQGPTERKATLPLKSQNKWMKGIVMAETTTVNWEKPIYWLLNALKKQNLENFNSNSIIEESRLTIIFIK